VRFRIQTEDGRNVEWEQVGPLPVCPVLDDSTSEHVLMLDEDEAQELCMELAYQIMRARHPVRGSGPHEFN
jgi:hypothetical protein